MSATPRLQRLRDALRQNELDAFLISSPEARRYLSGFTGSAGYLLISQSDAVLATDFRYVEQAGRQAPLFRVERIAGKMDWFPKLASQLGARKIGFEGRHMTVGAHSAFQKAIAEAENRDGLALVEASDTVDVLRATKYREEMELLARAIEITDQAFDEVASTIRAGVTEREVAWRLEKAMRERGAEGLAFDVIVGAGPNGALPHHRADDTVIGNDSPVVIDMGARYEGYCADLTRTIVVGEPDETFRRVYETVLRAQLAAEEGVESGMTGGEVDAISRDIIDEAGYGDSFGHGLGHGVGLAVHEFPRVGPDAEDAIEDGMVFTIEPGIYLSDWGGVRIEDVVVMEHGRARVLSRAPKLEYSS
jgi:Xaa-Pro aminopeptidase